MINPGAMAVGSIFAQDLEPAARFQLFMKRLQQFAGSEHVGFSQPTYLCEQETAWRNNAILFYLSHAGVFPTVGCNMLPATVVQWYSIPVVDLAP